MMRDFSGYFEVVSGTFCKEFERPLLAAVFDNLDFASPLRPNNFAYALREALDTMLKRLAPDDQVLASSWYENSHPKKENWISHRQRMHYALCKGLALDHVGLKGLDLADVLNELKKKRNRLNDFTHVSPQTFALSVEAQDGEIEEIVNALAAFCEQFSTIAESVQESIIGSVHEDIWDHHISETDPELMEISNGYEIEEVVDYEHELVSIDAARIVFSVSGDLTVTQHMGGKRDGVSMRNQYPFSCQVEFPLSDKEWKYGSVTSFYTDTDSWLY